VLGVSLCLFCSCLLITKDYECDILVNMDVLQLPKDGQPVQNRTEQSEFSVYVCV